MDQFASGKKVMHGGSYNSQSIAMAATVATLKMLMARGTYRTLERQGKRLSTVSRERSATPA
jgi:glutamate-1-semialdehyde aminotransferase